MSIFRDTLGLEEEDPILSLGVAFQKEARPNKVNLGIGAYQTAEGTPFVLPSVRAAEHLIFDQKLDKDYLPIEGHAEFLKGTLGLVFGENSPILKANRVAIVQTIGATSALRLASEYLVLQHPREGFLSDPTWSNHRALMGRSGIKVQTYPYFHPTKHVLDFESFCAAVEAMPAGSVVLMHACCHNPTGVDPTAEQWKTLSSLIKARNLFPFFDLAYQGFGHGLEQDAFPVRFFAEQGHEMFVAYSFSKNFGLYGERVGALLAVCSDAELAQKVQRQLKTLIRAAYSTAPLHGARIVDTVLHAQSLRLQWENELAQMRQRIREIRNAFIDRLQARVPGDLTFMRTQNGLFSYGLLQTHHVSQLRARYAIFMPASGRINIAGLHPRNLDQVVQAIVTVLGNT
jgi:aspartate aminotransferase